MGKRSKRTLVICIFLALAAATVGELFWIKNAKPDRAAEVVPVGVRLVSVAASPDGKLLVVGGYEKNLPAGIVLLDARTLQPIGKFTGQASGPLSFLGDGSLLASYAPDHLFCVWDMKTQKAILSLPTDSTCGMYGVSPDRRWVGIVGPAVAKPNTGAHFGTAVRVWDSLERKEVKSITVLDALHRSIAIAPGGKLVAMGESFPRPGGGDVVMLYDERGDKPVSTELPSLVKADPKQSTETSCLKFSPDGTRLYGSRGSGEIEVWDTRTKELLMTWSSGVGGAMTISLSADGSLAVSGGGLGGGKAGYENCDLRVWRTSDGTLLARVPGPSQPVGQIAFMADGKRIVSCRFDRMIRTWDLTSILSRMAATEQRAIAAGYPLAPKRQPELVASLGSAGAGSVSYDIFTPDGKAVLRVDCEGNVQLWSTQTWQRTGALLSDKPNITGLASGTLPIISADGAVLAVARYEAGGPGSGRGRMVDLWDIQSAHRLRTIELDGALAGIGLSGDGQLLYGRSGTGESSPLQAINVPDGQRRDLFAPATGVAAFSISRDGALLAVSGRNGVDIVDAAYGSISCHIATANVCTIRFSADGTMLAGVDGGMLRWWSASSGGLLGSFAVSHQLWGAPSLSPDGKLLAIPTNPHLILVDTASGKVCGQLPGSLRHLATFSPDGQWLMVTEGKKTEVYIVASLLTPS